jgi:CRISPR/Cas system-associated exonuclease Cas4 (RecB family)
MAGVFLQALNLLIPITFMMTIATNRPFTKSVFKTALSCPAKLYYARHKEAYANSNEEDEFLAALAEGGFQVGELAKLYEHVDADLHDILGYSDALAETERLLARDKVVIAEAAFGVGNMFIRADIVRKDGKHIDLIEVKAKSFNPETESWMGKRQKDSVQTEWREYLYDLAFQKYVVTQALPEYDVHAYLMLADKSRVADIDNLNQLFKIRKINGRTSIEVSPDAQAVLAQSKVQVLTAFDAEEVVNAIINGTTSEQADCLDGRTFVPFVKEMCEAWTNDMRLTRNLSTSCFKCEFCSADAKLKDGRDECWLSKAGYAPSQNPFPQVAELWSQYYQGRNELLQDGIFFLKDIPQDRIPLKSHSNLSEGLTVSERRWLQIAIATQDKDLIRLYGDDLKGDVYLDGDGMRMWLKEHNVQPPYHMIDFETTAVALPYYKGMHPYEQVAFQFSHHIMEPNPDGTFTIRHAGQWLNKDVNAFPNFEFVRALKRELEKDNGTIFRYSNHENTILNEIKRQLEESSEPDKAELIAWIKTITHEGKECGARDMIDLCEIVKKFYYCYSQMHGSNSIKQVLPAVLNSSKFLQDKYSQAIYGSEIPSKNIKPNEPIAWIERLPDGTIDNPYHQLPSVSIYLGITKEQEQAIEAKAGQEGDMTVANGGAALTAYNKLMFCDDGKMDEALRTALLRYCELDTMAMVFIWEYFYHEIYKI